MGELSIEQRMDLIILDKNDQLEAENAALREQIEELAAALAVKDEALKESNALNINWASDAEPEVLAYYTEYKKVLAIAEKALALQPHAALVAKIKADAVREVASGFQPDRALYLTLLHEADRIERGGR